MNYNAMSVHELVMEIYYAGANSQSDRRQEAESALRKAVVREASVETCEWKENEDGMWDTSCENTFAFDDGGPEENEQKFCCYCGKPLKVVPFIYPAEEETP